MWTAIPPFISIGALKSYNPDNNSKRYQNYMYVSSWNSGINQAPFISKRHQESTTKATPIWLHLPLTLGFAAHATSFEMSNHGCSFG